MEIQSLGLHHRNTSNDRKLVMQEIFRMFLIAFLVCSPMYAAPRAEVTEDDETSKNEFWPPDLIPHPHPPHPDDSEDGGWAEYK